MSDITTAQEQSVIVQHTLTIFERTYANLPPLVPEDVAHDMGAAMEQLRANFGLNVAELEDTMIAFGRKVWPYLQAFEELYNVYQSELGEKLFVQKAPASLRKAYTAHCEGGGSWREFYVGNGADGVSGKISSEDRVTMHQLLVDIQCDVRAFAFQAVLQRDRVRYETRIKEFQNILAEMEARLDGLRRLAEDEQEHPQLAAEIREHIRAFEYGLAFLGPKMDYHTVCNAHEHFAGRRALLKGRQA